MKRTNPAFLRWSFWLAEELPGPSLDDAIELIQTVGSDPLAFAIVAGDSLRTEHVIATQFEVVGPAHLIRDLKSAYDLRAGSSTHESGLVRLRVVESLR